MSRLHATYCLVTLAARILEGTCEGAVDGNCPLLIECYVHAEGSLLKIVFNKFYN